MLDFQLFRLKLVIPAQGEVFGADPMDRASILARALDERPTAQLRAGYQWRVGNVEQLDDHGFYFAVGRLSPGELPQFDPETRDFILVDLDQAPYTYALVDFGIGLLAVARNYQLSPRHVGIARPIASLLSQTDVVRELRGRVVVDPIRDPEEFIEYLRTAWAVTWFKMTFGLPNPFDVNRDFHRPMEKLLRDADGSNGHTTVRGDQLDPEVLEELARSAAATGEEASARMRSKEGGPLVRRSLTEKSVRLRQEEPRDNQSRFRLLETMRERYRSIRGDGQ